MPISLALPTLVDTSARSLQNYEEQLRVAGLEYPDDLMWEPAYEEELGRLQVYFSYLKVPTKREFSKFLMAMKNIKSESNKWGITLFYEVLRVIKYRKWLKFVYEQMDSNMQMSIALIEISTRC